MIIGKRVPRPDDSLRPPAPEKTKQSPIIEPVKPTETESVKPTEEFPESNQLSFQVQPFGVTTAKHGGESEEKTSHGGKVELEVPLGDEAKEKAQAEKEHKPLKFFPNFTLSAELAELRTHGSSKSSLEGSMGGGVNILEYKSGIFSLKPGAGGKIGFEKEEKTKFKYELQAQAQFELAPNSRFKITATPSLGIAGKSPDGRRASWNTVPLLGRGWPGCGLRI